eukprot:767264_1
MFLTIAPPNAPSLAVSITPITHPSSAASSYIAQSKAPTEASTIAPSRSQIHFTDCCASISVPAIQRTDKLSVDCVITRPYIGTIPSFSPSAAPTLAPSKVPTIVPRDCTECCAITSPSLAPTVSPSFAPTGATRSATFSPSNAPALAPSNIPTLAPSVAVSSTHYESNIINPFTSYNIQ